MSTEPNRRTVAWTHSSAWSASPAFAACQATSPPSAAISAAAASSASGLRDDNMTFAPDRAKQTAMAFPMPRLAPVTRATFPSRRISTSEPYVNLLLRPCSS